MGWWHLVLVVLAVLVVSALCTSYLDVRRYGGVDLRPRVTGALRFSAGSSPYVGWDVPAPRNWTDPLGEEYFSRCSYPPSTLLVYRIGAGAEYRHVRYGWAVAEWSLLFATILLLAKVTRRRAERQWLVVAATLLFVCGQFWRLHVERGQYYVILTFLWAVAALVGSRRGTNSYLFGFSLGLATAMRPTGILGLASLAVTRRWRALAGACGGIACLVVPSLLIGGLGPWRDFSRLVAHYERIITGQEAPGPQRVGPWFDDGYDMTTALPSATFNTSLVNLLHSGEKLDLFHAAPSLYPLVARGVLGSVLAGLGVVLWRRRRLDFDFSVVVLWATVPGILADFTSPIRESYVDVVFLVPLALALPALMRATGRSPLRWAGLLALVAMSLGALSNLPFIPSIARSLLVALALLGVLAFHPSKAPTNGTAIAPRPVG